jgi:hypothetical protein
LSARFRKLAHYVCPNIAATPDSKQVWFTLKDTGKTQVFDGQPPFALLKTLDTGPITNHVKIVRNANGMFAYVTIGGLNEIKVFRTDNFEQVATIPVGTLPHGIWPSGDGTRVYISLLRFGQAVHQPKLSRSIPRPLVHILPRSTSRPRRGHALLLARSPRPRIATPSA